MCEVVDALANNDLTGGPRDGRLFLVCGFV
jgi:hypothetical protein